MQDCIFCKIAEGKIPCAKVYEDSKVLSFLDISPTKKGHALVIPKEHYDVLTSVPDELLKELIVAVKKISRAVMKATGAGGVNLGLNMHEVAGQSVLHAHFHIIPRHEGDGLKPWPQGKYDDGESARYAEQIRQEL